MLFISLHNALVPIVAVDGHLDDVLLLGHLGKLDLLLLLRHLHEHQVRNESQGDPHVAVPPRPPHPVDVGYRRHVLVLRWLVVVYHQTHRADVDASPDGLRPQQHLQLLVPQLSYPGCFGG